MLEFDYGGSFIEAQTDCTGSSLLERSWTGVTRNHLRHLRGKMKLVNDTVLKENYDVIVVGAGLGGLASASLLAKRGVSVLLVEQQAKPGGSCTSFKP